MAFNRYSLSFILITLLLIASPATGAQHKWGFEIRPGINVATSKLGNADLKTDYGIEGTFSYRIMPHLGAYAGWSWNRFSADKSFVGNNMDFEETGYIAGLEFIHPIQSSDISYMIRCGGTYNHIETENSDGNIINDTGHGLGWQIGGGIAIPIATRWRLVPEVRYRSLSRTIKLQETSTPADLNYISGGIGLSYSF